MCYWFSSIELSKKFILRRLLESLKSFSNSLQIPICYCDPQIMGETVAGKTVIIIKCSCCETEKLRHVTNIEKNIQDLEHKAMIIFIPNDKVNDPFTLGHEIGHILSKLHLEDDSETSANYYMMKLIATILTDFEFTLIEDKLSTIIDEVGYLPRTRKDIIAHELES